jgi:4-hydroxybenzoate polyprenyltransferase
MSLPVALIKALRPKQWAKQVFLVAALIFSFEFLNIDAVWRTLWGVACFNLISSTGYIFNDIRDREADALHPKKRKRPIASGALSIRAAQTLMAVICVVGFVASYALSPAFAGVTLLYFISTMSYTLVFKHMVIVDVMLIAAGFLWRAVAGAVAIDVVISPWLLLCTGFLALFLGFNKRRAEVTTMGDKAADHRKNLADYSIPLLDEFQAITTSCTVISYALYCVLASPSPWLLLTLPYVVFFIFRYIFLVQRGEGGAVEDTLSEDRPILVTAVLYSVTAVAVLLLA